MVNEQRLVGDQTPDNESITSIWVFNFIKCRLIQCGGNDATLIHREHSLKKCHLSSVLLSRALFFIQHYFAIRTIGIDINRRDDAPHLSLCVVRWKDTNVTRAYVEIRSKPYFDISGAARSDRYISPLTRVSYECEHASKYHDEEIGHRLAYASFPEPGDLGPSTTDDFLNAAFHWTLFILLSILFVMRFAIAAMNNNVLAVLLGWIIMFWWLVRFIG
jgi:hypothetical protein